MARPWTKLPPGARDALEAMAATSGLKESTAARALGMPVSQFRKVIKHNPEAAELWEDALSIERDALLERLWNRSKEGDVQASKYLLAARHGMSEQRPPDKSERVNVTFVLPSAMDPGKYLEQIKPDAIAHSPEAPAE